jgi:hypothetical protein
MIHSHPTGTQYSEQVLGLVSDKGNLSSIPFPRLAPFLSGLLRRFNESNNNVFAMCAEQLVDGMDLDEEWCESCLDAGVEEVYRYAVQGKSRHVSPMYPDHVSCYISTPDEAAKVRGIPGRN